jgi:hypothetical protein
MASDDRGPQRSAQQAGGALRVCEVDDCGKPTRSRSAALCAMHYHRQYRHGSVDTVLAGTRSNPANASRYVTVYTPDHRIKPGGGMVHRGRLALWDAIGEGPHACHWCGVEVRWMVVKGVGTSSRTPGYLSVDHLDEDRANDDPSNLAPACMPCNTDRAAALKHQRLRAQGFWSANDTQRGRRAART